MDRPLTRNPYAVLNPNEIKNTPYIDDAFDFLPILGSRDVRSYLYDKYKLPVVAEIGGFVEGLNNAWTGQQGRFGPGMGLLSYFGRTMDKSADPILAFASGEYNPLNIYENIFKQDMDYTGKQALAGIMNVAPGVNVKPEELTGLGWDVAGLGTELILDPGIFGAMLGRVSKGNQALSSVAKGLSDYDNFIAKMALNAAAPGSTFAAKNLLRFLRQTLGASNPQDLANAPLKGKGSKAGSPPVTPQQEVVKNVSKEIKDTYTSKLSPYEINEKSEILSIIKEADELEKAATPVVTKEIPATKAYEVSSKGDSRFSALKAKLKDGRTIEEAYQLDIKGYRKLGNDWRLGKGKPPLLEYTAEEGYKQYKKLWETYLNENPELLKELTEKVQEGYFLKDSFAKTKINQASVLQELVEENISKIKKVPVTKVKLSEVKTDLRELPESLQLKNRKLKRATINTAEEADVYLRDLGKQANQYLEADETLKLEKIAKLKSVKEATPKLEVPGYLKSDAAITKVVFEDFNKNIVSKSTPTFRDDMLNFIKTKLRSAKDLPDFNIEISNIEKQLTKLKTNFVDMSEDYGRIMSNIEINNKELYDAFNFANNTPQQNIKILEDIIANKESLIKLNRLTDSLSELNTPSNPIFNREVLSNLFETSGDIDLLDFANRDYSIIDKIQNTFRKELGATPFKEFKYMLRASNKYDANRVNIILQYVDELAANFFKLTGSNNSFDGKIALAKQLAPMEYVDALIASGGSKIPAKYKQLDALLNNIVNFLVYNKRGSAAIIKGEKLGKKATLINQSGLNNISQNLKGFLKRYDELKVLPTNNFANDVMYRLSKAPSEEWDNIMSNVLKNPGDALDAFAFETFPKLIENGSISEKTADVLIKELTGLIDNLFDPSGKLLARNATELVNSLPYKKLKQVLVNISNFIKNDEGFGNTLGVQNELYRLLEDGVEEIRTLYTNMNKKSLLNTESIKNLLETLPEAQANLIIKDLVEIGDIEVTLTKNNIRVTADNVNELLGFEKTIPEEAFDTARKVADNITDPLKNANTVEAVEAGLTKSNLSTKTEELLKPSLLDYQDKLIEEAKVKTIESNPKDRTFTPNQQRVQDDLFELISNEKVALTEVERNATKTATELNNAINEKLIDFEDSFNALSKDDQRFIVSFMDDAQPYVFRKENFVKDLLYSNGVKFTKTTSKAKRLELKNHFTNIVNTVNQTLEKPVLVLIDNGPYVGYKINDAIKGVQNDLNKLLKLEKSLNLNVPDSFNFYDSLADKKLTGKMQEVYDKYIAIKKSTLNDTYTKLGWNEYLSTENIHHTYASAEEDVNFVFQDILGEGYNPTALKGITESVIAHNHLKGRFETTIKNRSYEGPVNLMNKNSRGIKVYFDRDLPKMLKASFGSGIYNNRHFRSMQALFLNDNFKIKDNFRDVKHLRETLEQGSNIDNLLLATPVYDETGQLIKIKRYDKLADKNLLKALEDDNAIIIPNQFLSSFDRILKKEQMLSNKLFREFNKAFTVPFKFALLTNPGFLIGNAMDGIFKGITMDAYKYNIPITKAALDYSFKMKEVIEISNEFSKLYDRFLLDMNIQVPYDILRKNKKLYNEFSAWMDDAVTKGGTPSGLKVEGLYKLTSEERELIRVFEIIHNYQPMNIVGEVADLGKLSSADFPINEGLFHNIVYKMSVDNPIAKFTLNKSTELEGIMRGAHILTELNRRGIYKNKALKSTSLAVSDHIAMVDAVNKMNAANFSYDDITDTMAKISMVIPFPTFFMKNMVLWLDMMFNNHQLVESILDTQEVFWGNRDEEKQIKDSFEVEAKGRGAVPTPIGILKQTPTSSLFSAFGNINDPLNNLLFRLNPALKFATLPITETDNAKYRPYSTNPFEKNIKKGDPNFNLLVYQLKAMNPYERPIQNLLRAPAKASMGSLQASDILSSIFQPDFNKPKK
jgi:hypothetical protein